jgi:hypothetical protein
MDEAERLSLSDMHNIVGQIVEGKPDPDQTRLLITELLDRINRNPPIKWPLPEVLLDWLKFALPRYLNGTEPNLEKALGLKRGKGRPATEAARKRKCIIARDVYELMQQGQTLEGAAATLSKEYHLHESKIQDIWASFKQEGRILYRVEQTHQSIENDSVSSE